MTVVGFLLCAGLGWYGAVKAFRYWMSREKKPLVFTGLGSAAYLLLAGLSYALYLSAEGAGIEATGGQAAVPVLLVVPVLMFPYAIYLAGLLVSAFSAFFSPLGSMEEVRSYDKGDGAMARKDFKAAEAFYRRDLARWPGDVQALIRLARALELDGRVHEAIEELREVRTSLLEGESAGRDATVTASAAQTQKARKDRNEHVMALTYILGDLYVGRMKRPDQARLLYEQTLERLYGYPGVDPLRERLKVLQGQAGGA